MSNFNEYFKSVGLKRMMDEFLDGVDEYSEVKITKLDYRIREDLNYPANYYIENNMTAEFRVIVEYEQDGDGIIKEAELAVPKEIEGAFIMDGAYRLATATLGRDFECRIYDQGSGTRGVTFDFGRRFDFDSYSLLITNIDPNLGFINEKSIEIPFSQIDSVEGPRKELLRLTEKQRKKFQIKLDLDYDPEFISQRLIEDCKAMGDDRVHDYIIDKTVDTVASSFMYYLFSADKRKNFYTTKSKIRSNYSRYGRINLSYLTSLCNRYFRKGSSELQIPPGINPLNLDSYKSKIQINPTVAYNPTMSDIIDLADTPINGHTNLHNSLTVSTHVTDDGVFFDVYDKEFNKITIPYIDYLNSKVVASEYVDYTTNTLKPDNGKLEVKYRMRRKMVDENDYDLIDLHPDYRLSSTSRRIPFVNFTDSVRISMGTSMIKQSIQLINAERPLVDTGNNEDMSHNVIADKYQGTEGEVVEVTTSEVVIKDDDGKTYKVPKRSYLPSLNNISVYSEAKVKVGDRVKNGDVIVGGVNVEDDTVKVGLNANVLFHAYHGLINEDAVVVSESFADKMAHYSIVDLSINVKINSALNWIAPVGTVVKFKDPIVKCKKTAVLNDVTKIIRDKILGEVLDTDINIDDYTTDYNLIVPNNIEQAVVADVRVQRNNPIIPKNIKAPDYTYADTSEEVWNAYKVRMEKDRKVIVDNYPEYISDDRLKEFELDRHEHKLVYVVKVRLIVYNRLKVADKLTNRYGGKGVISKIVPDKDMPIVNGKKIEVILNPYALINRKIPSQIMEIFLSNIAIKLHENVESMKNGHMDEIMPMINKYYGAKFSKMSVQDFIKLHNERGMDIYSFDVGCFSHFTPELIQKWGEELGVSTMADVEMPEKELVDLDELKKELSEDEYNEYVKSIEGKFTKVGKPLMSGGDCKPVYG